MKREHARQLLRQRRQELVSRLASLEEGLRQGAKDSVQELSMYDNHPADLGSETFERQKDLGTRYRLKQHLLEVDSAMRRVEQGSYGRCERCGAPIDTRRLEVVPATRYCVGCQKKADAHTPSRGRPIEEEVIRPPFGIQSMLSHGPAYDGRDTWEDVARYGTASTPQDQPGSRNYRDLYLEEEPDDGVVQEVEGLVDEAGEPIDERARQHRRGRRPGSH
ncbi:MAG: TraR/DksA C4-type zinc finger protein [Bacillota bacterium]